MSVADELMDMAIAATNEHEVATLAAASVALTRYHELLANIATTASRIAVPVCDDGGGFHHCCGGSRGCRSDCAIQQVRALVRADLAPFVREATQ